jgi:hypothetical protein
MADGVPIRIPREPEALAAMMRGPAEAFITMANGTLDWGPEAEYAIDGWCAHFLPSMPDRPGIKAGLSLAMGAYLEHGRGSPSGDGLAVYLTGSAFRAWCRRLGRGEAKPFVEDAGTAG